MTLPDAVRDAWHLALLSRDLPRGRAVPVTVCDTPLAVFRTADGVAALIDRCPHRNYPLSEGRVVQNTVQCPYHGWRFAGDGACAEVPGCSLDGVDARRLRAAPVRATERAGAVFVALSDAAPDAPPLPPDVGDDALHSFWWSQGVWTGRAFDAIENVMDPFHTNHLHDGFIRRQNVRQPAELRVTSHGDGIDMTIRQAKPDAGLMSRALERERTHSITRYHPPTTVQARWMGPKGLTLCVTAVFTPVTEDSFAPFARFSTPKGVAPGWLKQALIRLFLRPVAAQDRRALARQHAVMTRFGSPRFVSGPGDLMGGRLHRLWQGETLPIGEDAPVQARL